MIILTLKRSSDKFTFFYWSPECYSIKYHFWSVTDIEVPNLHQITSLLSVNPMSTVQEELAALKRTVENIKDPLYRFFERECTIGRNLLRTVLTDLNDVAQVGGVWNEGVGWGREPLSSILHFPLLSLIWRWKARKERSVGSFCLSFNETSIGH